MTCSTPLNSPSTAAKLFRRAASTATAVLALTLALPGSGWARTPADSMEAIVHDFLVSGLVFFSHDKSTHLFIGDPALKDEAALRTEDIPAITAEMTRLRERLNALPPPMTNSSCSGGVT